jgi:hypothetical protein
MTKNQVMSIKFFVKIKIGGNEKGMGVMGIIESA